METVQKLLALQELVITLKETEIVHGASSESERATQLKARINAMRSEFSPDILARFDRLSRQGLAVVKIKNDTCLGCNIGIARGDVNRIASGKLEPICPHCGKYVIISA